MGGFIGGCDNPATRPSASKPANVDEQPQSLPTVKMSIGRADFTVEVADNEPEQMKGMMFRDYNPADHGMIFIFPDEQPRSFWMKNTRIALDIIFVDHNGKV